MIHQQATAQTLGLVRAWVFGIWWIVIAGDPFYLFAEFPRSVLDPIGVLRFVPDAMWSTLFSESMLIGYKVLTLLVVTGAMLGVRPYRPIAILACVGLTFHQTFVRSHGHYNHSELGLLYCSYLLAVFPAGDGFRWGRWDDREYQPASVYAGALLLMTISLSLTYTQISAFRLAYGFPDVLTKHSMDYWLARDARQTVFYGFEVGLWVLNHPVLVTATRIGFVVVTFFELLTPVCIVSRRFRYAWLIVLVPFHFGTHFMMRIFFWHNLLLLMVLFVDISWYMAPRPPGDKKRVIFFDGYCGLCNRFIDWIDAHDHARVFHYAPLQGDAAEQAGVKDEDPDPAKWTIVLHDEDGTWRRSDAALRIISGIGGVYGFATLLRFIPHPIRDTVYKIVARYRYRFFGKRETCRLPSPQQRSRFLT